MKKNKKVMFAHILAFFTVIIWGTTFISTKVLLEEFTPVEILIYRFVVGYFVLTLFKPIPLPFQGIKKEIWYMLAGLSGVTIYFLFENSALTYTLASNVSIIVSLAPMFTAILGFLFLKQEKPGKFFFLGFLVAMLGIVLINYNGRTALQLNPIGDVLAIGAAFVWAVYSIVLKAKIPTGKEPLRATKRIFFYGILSMIPCSLFMGFTLDFDKILQPLYFGNIVYLGIFASAIGYLLWNHAIEVLGTLRSSVYIYIIPVITIIASALVLKEQVTLVIVTGAVLAICGLLISEKKE